MDTSPEPIACTLAADDASTRLREWSDLRNHATGIEPLVDGARMRFPAELGPDIQDLVGREAACCAFLSITTVRNDDELIVDVTSVHADAMAVISTLAGISEK